MVDPTLTKLLFHWKGPDKYLELCNFEIEVKKHFSDKQLQYTEKSQ